MLIFIYFILFCLIGLLIGIFLMINPVLAIEIQRRFYEQINWRIEPISLEKELRNTRIMGFLLIILSVATSLPFFFKKLLPF